MYLYKKASTLVQRRKQILALGCPPEVGLEGGSEQGDQEELGLVVGDMDRHLQQQGQQPQPTGNRLKVCTTDTGSVEGCGSGSVGSICFWASRGSRSFYHPAKIVRKTLIPTVL